MTDVTTLLAGIKTLEEAANDGPWFAVRYYIGSGEDHSDPDAEIATAGSKADAAFIAAARTDVPRLVAALEAVAGLHTPFVWDFGFGLVTSCRGCADQGVPEAAAAYPCPTITAVVAALGEG